MMNNDRELLELAAKADGVLNWTERTNGLFIETGSFRGSSGYMWNPLTDDGDALRLAVKLDIVIWECSQYNCALTEIRYGKNQGEVIEPIQDEDRYAATRRAIVRAAAEIGRTMK
jgi:hypothetical protein